ncbi:MAG: hypothetical protein CM1200mP10_10210 [Candidatus Neomarinimicrobiota bacterium]|nr:MAG: hypothetical protein CM1200mP10_10210 [Candidatus Neomarinimicrobiota bacterium]
MGIFLSSYGGVDKTNALALIGGAEFRLASTVFSQFRIKTVFGVAGAFNCDPREEKETMNFLMIHLGFIYAL